jgi:LAO/AO transport system kinase
VTKADLQAPARRAVRDLNSALRALGEEHTAIVAVSAIAPPQGIEDLVEALEAHRRSLCIPATRLRARRMHALADFAAEHGESGLRRLGGRRAAEQWLAAQDPNLDVPALFRALEAQAG